jgi:Na+-driven multidrug efflux pump
MLTNIIGGLQGIIDHVLVGNLVGFKGNAAIGVSVADLPRRHRLHLLAVHRHERARGALRRRGRRGEGRSHVYQAFLTAVGLSLSSWRRSAGSRRRAARPRERRAAVKAEALPFLRIMFLFSSGMMVFFMLGGALRSPATRARR